MDLTNKVAVVTGGARGLGRGFAEALLQRGANIVIADVLVSTGLQTVNELSASYGPGKLMFIQCNVSKEEELKRLFKTVKSQYGHIDIMVNNAGIADEDNWRKMVDINLSGVIYGTMLALQYMNKDNGGRGGLIVNTASTGGLTPVPGEPVYAATKYGVVGFTRSMAGRTFETTDHNIRVTCICPSFTATPMVLHGRGVVEDVQKMINSLGIMEPARVVEAFMKIVDNPDNNGGVLAVIPKSMTYRHPRELRGKL